MTDWKKIYQEIENADSIMLTTHENPDGDGIGSIVALHHHIMATEKKCRILLTSELPEEFYFLDPGDKFEIFEGLAEYAINSFLKIFLAIVDGHDNCYFRAC